MELSQHSLNDLFDQLGLPSSDRAIDAFINEHRPIRETVKIEEADCFSSSQQAFLQEAMSEDSDWVIVVEHLDAMLRCLEK